MKNNEIKYSQTYYQDIWANIINKFGTNTPVTDLGDISRSDTLNSILYKYVKPGIDSKFCISDFGPGNWLYLPTIVNWATKTLSDRKTVISGYDFSLHAMQFAQKKFPEITKDQIEYSLNEGNIEELIKDVPSSSQNLLFSLETLEHIEKDRYVVSQFSRIIKRGGYAIISFPNWKLPFFSKDWFAYRDREILLEKDVHVGHYRRYTPKTMAELFDNTEFKIIKIYRYGFLLSDYLKVSLSFVEKRLPSLFKLFFPIIRSILRIENAICNILMFKRSEGIFVVLEKI